MHDDIYSSALRAATNLSKNELIGLIQEYPNLAHVKEALYMKEQNIRVYVASAYDALLNRGYKIDEVLAIAKGATGDAKRFFRSRFFIFSPVLAWGKESISRKEAMSRCFKELIKSQFLYISDTPYVLNSSGVLDEYKFAKKNNISVVFANKELKDKFLDKYNKGIL